MKVKCQMCSPNSIGERDNGKKKKKLIDMLFY